MAEFIRVARCDEVPGERGLVVEVKGRYVAIYSVNGAFHATDNTCLHQGASLGDGDLIGSCIVCPWHGWRYDVTSGACLTNPKGKLRTFPVHVDGENILIGI